MERWRTGNYGVDRQSLLNIPPEKIDLDEAQERLRRVLDRANSEQRRIVVEAEGQPLAAIVSLDDVRRLQELDRRRAVAMERLDAIGAAFADADPDEVDREIAKALAEARAEMRAEREAAAGS